MVPLIMLIKPVSRKSVYGCVKILTIVIMICDCDANACYETTWYKYFCYDAHRVIRYHPVLLEIYLLIY